MLCFSSAAIGLPPQAVTTENDKQPIAAKETRIVFTYTPKDCCSCQITPDICGGGFYINSVQRRIMYYWCPPPIKSTDPVKVRFRIHKNGRLSDLRLVKAGTPGENVAAMDAVKSAAPFFKLPVRAPEFVDLEYAFSKPSASFRRFGEGQRQSDTIAIAPYLLILQDKIGDTWAKPSTNVADVVVVKFQVHTDGSLTDRQIVQSSSLSNANSLALASVEKASPLDLPPGLPAELWVQVTFNPGIRFAWISEALVKR